MGTDEALAGVFHSPEPAASDSEALPPLHRSHFHCAWVPGQEAATTHRAEARPDHAFMSQPLQKAWEKKIPQL